MADVGIQDNTFETKFLAFLRLLGVIYRVLDMWGQANRNNMVLQPLSAFGWDINNDILTIDWDSNMQAVQEQMTSLLKGCKCKTGCRNKRCGCRGKGKTCSVGCECITCTNTTAMKKKRDNLLDVTMDKDLLDVDVNESDDTWWRIRSWSPEFTDDLTGNPDDSNDILDWVFGEAFEGSDSFTTVSNWCSHELHPIFIFAYATI